MACWALGVALDCMRWRYLLLLMLFVVCDL
jgi:hypothetical protein